VVDRFFAKEMHAKTINIDNYREATLEEKEAYEAEQNKDMPNG
jgi:hypothetical protein